ncbi:ribbon-helix-helix DNA binding domain protein [Mycobacterium phage Knocker]|nr:ribbon-helix-helix DNA binding domain protein [Mycobacterium phage Knocker]
MPSSSRTRVVAGGTTPSVLLPVKVRPDLRQRFKVAAAEEGTTYAGLIERWLDERDRRIAAQRRAQAHPLHRPAASAYPGGGQR